MAKAGWLLTPLCVLLLGPRAAQAESDGRDLFRQGRVELQGGAGVGATDNQSYLLLLVGGGYYLCDGLSVGAAGEAWLGSEPEIGDVSPQLRYVFLDLPWRWKPYAGVFYRRTFFSREYLPLDSTGARSGLVVPLGSRSYLTGGLVYESYFHCGANSIMGLSRGLSRGRAGFRVLAACDLNLPSKAHEVAMARGLPTAPIAKPTPRPRPAPARPLARR